MVVLYLLKLDNEPVISDAAVNNHMLCASKASVINLTYSLMISCYAYADAIDVSGVGEVIEPRRRQA